MICELSYITGVYFKISILLDKVLGEEGYDAGGPRREFFRLLADDVKKSMCITRNGHSYSLRHDVYGLQVSRFYNLNYMDYLS